MRAALLASSAFIAAPAAAQNAIWQAAPTVAGPVAATFDFNANANWIPATVPTGTASFDATTGPNISFSALSTTLGTLQFNVGAPAYTFTATNSLLTLTGAGIVDNSSNKPSFVLNTTNAGSIDMLKFQNAATAGDAVITATPGLTGSPQIQFFNTSSAGNATMTLTAPARVNFHDSSTAGSATIDGEFFFTDSSNAGNAKLKVRAGDDQDSFFGASTAANSQITIQSGAIGLVFENASSGGNAVIDNAGAGVPVLGLGSIVFTSSSTATDPTVRTPTAANATITNHDGGELQFGTYTLTFPLFPNIDFTKGTGSAGNATIINNNGGTTTFLNQSDAGTATITNNNGGSLFFKNAGGLPTDPDASHARVINNAGGQVDISGVNTGVSIGSVEGAGDVFLGSKVLTLGNTNLSTEISGTINDGGASGGVGGSLVKIGTGTLLLSATNGYSGGTMITGGTVQVTNADSVGSGAVTLNGGTFQLATGFSGIGFANAFKINAPGGTVDNNGGLLELSGTISNGNGTTGLLQLTDSTGGGTTLLSGVNTYTGGTKVVGTTVQVNNDSSVGTGLVTLENALFMAADIVPAGSLAFTNNFVINNTPAGSAFDVNGYAMTISGNIADGNGPGKVTVLDSFGGGVLIFTGAKTYTGGTTICICGTLQLGTLATPGSILGPVTNEGLLNVVNSDTSLITTLTNDGGQTNFFNGTTASAIAILSKNFGATFFFDASSAASASITNQTHGAVAFMDTATAGNSTITNSSGGLALFFGNSNAGTATITNNNGGGLLFADDASAANATIVNNANGATQFGSNGDAPTAGNATITNNAGGVTGFFAASTAANATIITNNGGAVGFFDNSTGGNAQFITNAGGIVDFSRTSGPAADGKITAGSIAGGGDYYLGGNQLTVGSNNLSTEVSGVIHDGASPLACECEPAGTGGSLVKVGTGKLILSGINTYTGPTTVDGGALIVNGSIASSSGVTVNAGGTVGGNGALPKTTINGGTLSPGNSIGTVTISGSLTFVGAGNYVVEVSPAAADKTNVNGTPGTAALAGTLSAVGLGGAYAVGTKYTVLTATGGVSGTFTNLAISGNFGFTKPHVEYDANAVYLVLDPTALPIAGLTPNQKAVAAAVNTAVTNGSQLPPFFALFGLPLTQLPAALDQLSGEVHVSTLGMLLDESLYPRLAVLGRLRQAAYGGAAGMAPLSFGGPQAFTAGEEQLAALAYGKSPIVTKAPPLGAPAANYDVTFWAQGFGAWGRFDTDANAATVERKLAGFFSGADTAIGSSGRAGLMAGYTGSTYALDRRGNANVETGHLAGYGGWNFGALNLRGGAAGAWHTIDTSRTAAFTGFFDSLTAHYQGRTAQIFGEAGYGFAFGKVAVEPFAGAAWVQVRTDAVNERGGAAALGFAGGSFEVGYSTFGIRAASIIPLANDMMLVPRVTAAWQHAFDDVTPTARLAFLGAPVPFTIAGVPLARDSLLSEAGLDLAIGRHATLGISYTGQFAGKVQDHAAKGKFTWKF